MTEEFKNLENAFVKINPIDSEPYVKLPDFHDMQNHNRLNEINLNQKRRQTEKFKFFMNSFDFLNDSQIRGDYFEFGVHKARTFRMALTCAKFYNIEDIFFHAFDSFEGLPNIEAKTIDQWVPGALSTSIENFKDLILKHGLYTENFSCYKGFFDKSLSSDLLEEIMKTNKKAIMINIDCDYYDSAVSVFNFIEPLIQHGTIIYLDDAFAGFTKTSNGGVLKAFKNFEKKSNFEYIPHINIGWWGRSFIASQI